MSTRTQADGDRLRPLRVLLGSQQAITPAVAIMVSEGRRILARMTDDLLLRDRVRVAAIIATTLGVAHLMVGRAGVLSSTLYLSATPW